MKKRLTILTLVIVAVLAVPLLYAHGDAARRAMHGDVTGHAMSMFGKLQHLREELDLTDQQADQVKGILLDVHEQNARYRQQMHAALKEVARVLIANPNDVAAAQTLLDRQTETERALKSNMLQGVARAVAVLTPAQRAKLAAVLADHVERMESHHRR